MLSLAWWSGASAVHYNLDFQTLFPSAFLCTPNPQAVCLRPVTHSGCCVSCVCISSGDPPLFHLRMSFKASCKCYCFCEVLSYLSSSDFQPPLCFCGTQPRCSCGPCYFVLYIVSLCGRFPLPSGERTACPGPSILVVLHLTSPVLPTRVP